MSTPRVPLEHPHAPSQQTSNRKRGPSSQPSRQASKQTNKCANKHTARRGSGRPCAAARSLAARPAAQGDRMHAGHIQDVLFDLFGALVCANERAALRDARSAQPATWRHLASQRAPA